MGMVKKQDILFDSTKMENVGGPKKSSMPRFYFPIIITIILAEAVILGLILFDMFPIHVFQIYPWAQYGPYINASDLTQLSVTITKWFFFLLTAGVLIPTTIIIILEIARRFIVSRRGEEDSWDDDFPLLEKLGKQPKLPADAKKRVQGDYITRFDIHQRIQHYALMGSFIVLAVTGFLRGFPDWPTFAWFTSIFGGVEVLRLVHDIAAFVMIADGIYHLGYIAYGYFVKHKSPSAMFPKWKDLKDILHSSLWIFGMYKKEPQYDHFQYGQKIDYWAIFWGMPVMVITGIMMMFPSVFTPYIGGQWLAMMATAHRDEAILAVGFILIVHMYYGHLQTTAFPVNTVMFTGKMSKSKYKQWFGREYAQLTGEKEDKRS
jgi:cytochrome b subunit of formate dehydrogenase